MNINQRIKQALVDLISLVCLVELDMTTKSGKVETWTVTVMRRDQ